MSNSGSIPRWQGRAEAAPDKPGAYALLITLNKAIPLPARFPFLLKRGRYVYMGSAKAGGGIRARVTRHLSSDKIKHWHVDWLTTQANSIRFLPFPDGDECRLTSGLLEAGLEPPVLGLGSSDCQTCPSHLLKVPNGFKRSDLATILAG